MLQRTLAKVSPYKLHFTSDSHFFHNAAARHRGFTKEVNGETVADPDAMNEELIRDWNINVSPGDTVVHLGDFAFAGGKKTQGILDRLNGKIVLVRGNHDKGMNATTLDRFESVHDLLTVKVDGDNEQVRIVCCHFPLLSWDMAQHGAFHVHGHSHGSAKYPFVGRVMDVGVDTREGDWFAPYSFFEVYERLSAIKPACGDYHDKTSEGD